MPQVCYETYDSFFDQLSTRLSQMRSLGRDRMEEEKTVDVIDRLNPWADPPDVSVIADLEDAVIAFATTHCYGDLNALAELTDGLVAAQDSLKGIATPHRHVVEGLASWNSDEASDTFKQNYVDPVIAKSTTHNELIAVSSEYLTVVGEICSQTRLVTLGLVDSAIAELENYSPLRDMAVSTMNLAVDVLGRQARDFVEEQLVTVTKNKLPEAAGLSVTDLMSESQTALRKISEEKVAVEEENAGKLEDKTASIRQARADFVVAAPSTDEDETIGVC